MRVARTLRNLVIVGFSVLLMGQAKNCGDLSSLMPEIEKMFNSGGKSQKIYIANLSFMDAASKSIMGAGDAELVNTAVEEGMKTLSQQEPKYVINDPKHSLPNNDANAQKLNVIYWDQNLSRTEKVDKIIKDLMEPAGIDGLVAGQFIQDIKDGSVNLRPFVISRSTKNLVTESRTFKKEEFECKDPNNQNRKVLCDAAVEDIRKTVMNLLKQL
jgi:hypothetical protein